MTHQKRTLQEYASGQRRKQKFFPLGDVKAPAHVDFAILFDGMRPNMLISRVGGYVQAVDDRHTASEIARDFDFDIMRAR